MSNENNEYWANQQAYSFEVPTDQFGQELNFQSFSGENVDSRYSGPMYGSNPYLDPRASQYSGSMYSPSEPTAAASGDEFADEPPLLEELGINPEHIIQKTLAVLNPFRNTETDVVQDTDLAGPLVFCLAFGGLLLLCGKVHFNYIYGIGTIGCLGMFGLLSLMATCPVTVSVVISILGYCLLPMVALAGVNVFFSLQGLVGLILTCFTIFWCSLSASKLFVTALGMEKQQPLVAYPCALLYAVFALITVF